MQDLTIMWDKLKEANLQDKVVFASLNFFGCTLRYNTNGGRNHNGMHHTMLVAGSFIKPGVVGGIELTKPTATPVEFKATGINPNTHTSNNPDIAYRDTLVSAYKMLAKAAGLSDERINIRFNGGKIMTGALSQIRLRKVASYDMVVCDLLSIYTILKFFIHEPNRVISL